MLYLYLVCIAEQFSTVSKNVNVVFDFSLLHIRMHVMSIEKGTNPGYDADIGCIVFKKYVAGMK